MLNRNTSSGNGPINAEIVIARLEEAGRTLLALPNTGPSTRLVQSGLDWIRDAAQTGTHRGRVRPAIPDAAQITRMDQALGWIPIIPADRYVLRRIVGARCLLDPMTERHLFSWRRVGLAIGADHKAVQRWHGQGIQLIVALLRAQALGQQRPDAGPVSRAGSPRAAAAARS